MSSRKLKSESDAGDEEYAVNGIIGFNVDLDGSYWYEVEWAPPKHARKWPQGNATWQEESILKADGLDWAIKEFWACVKKNGSTKDAEIARLLAVNETVMAQEEAENMAAGSSRMKAKKAKLGLKQTKSLVMPELTVNLDLESRLEGEIFKECKDSFRPVKNKLRLLKSDKNSEEFAAALLEVGGRVNECLELKQGSEQLRNWHSYLWLFAALFTKLNGKELHELYKIHTTSPDKNQDTGIPKNSDGEVLKSGHEEVDEPLESHTQKKNKLKQKLEMASDSDQDCVFVGDLGKISVQELAALEERKRKKQQTKKKKKVGLSSRLQARGGRKQLRVKNHEAATESCQDSVFVEDGGLQSREPVGLPVQEQEVHKDEEQMSETVWHGRLRTRSSFKKNWASPEYEPETIRFGGTRSSMKKRRNYEAEPIPAFTAESHGAVVFKSPLSRRHTKILLKAVERHLETPKKRAASTKLPRTKSLPGLLVRLKGRLPRASTSKVTTRRANQKTTTNESSASGDWLVRRQLEFNLNLPSASNESNTETGIINEIVRDLETLMQQDKSEEKVPDYSDWQAERHKFDGYFHRPHRNRTMSAGSRTNAVSPRCTESRVSTSSVGLSSAVKAQQKDRLAASNRGAVFLPQFRCVPGEVSRHHCSVCDVSFPSRHRLSDHVRSLAHRRCENSQLRGLAAAAAKFNLSLQMPANFNDGSEFARKAEERGEYVLQSQAMQLLNSATSDHYPPIRSHSSQSLEVAAHGTTSAAGMNSLLCDLGAFANSEMDGGTFEIQQDVIAQNYEIEETVSTTYDEYVPNCASGSSAAVYSYTTLQPLAPMSVNCAILQQSSMKNVPINEPGRFGGFAALFNQQAMPNLSAAFGGSEMFIPFPSQSSYGMVNGVSNAYGMIELSHQHQPDGNQLGNFEVSQPRHYEANEILFDDAEELQRVLSTMQEGSAVNAEQIGMSAGDYDFPDSSELRASDAGDQFANPELMDTASGGLQTTPDSSERNAPTSENANIDFFYADNQPEMDGDLFNLSG